MRWRFQGSQGVEFLEENVHAAAGVKIAIILIGGNDLSNGMSARQLADRIGYAAEQMCTEYGADAVAIASIWPRADSVFNRAAMEFAGIMERRFFGDPRVTFWLWDRRQPFRTYDRTHLYLHGYYRAMTYLVAVIVWVIHHNQW